MIVVLDFGQVYQGPYATMLMAKGGADVIKIEPPQGEPLRRRAPPGKSTTFPIAMLNGNKRAITLNLKHERGRDLLFRMVEKADVLLENFAPGVMDRLGVGYEVLSRINPRLVYASGTGLRPVGPGPRQPGDGSDDPGDGRADQRRPAFRTGRRSKPARRSSISSPASISMRRRSRRCSSASAPARGRMVEVAMQEAAYATLTSQLEAYWQTGKVPPRTGNASHGRVPINVYPTNDGYVAMNLAVEEHWHSLLEGDGPRGSARRPAVQRRRRARVKNREETDALIAAWTQTLGKLEVFAIAKRHRIPLAPVRDVGEVMHDPHMHERGFLEDIEHDEIGPITVPNSPLRFHGADPVQRDPEPEARAAQRRGLRRLARPVERNREIAGACEERAASS